MPGPTGLAPCSVVSDEEPTPEETPFFPCIAFPSQPQRENLVLACWLPSSRGRLGVAGGAHGHVASPIARS